MASRYLSEVYSQVEYKRSPVPLRGMLQLAPGQNAHGYGDKISTDYMVRINNRWRRVYCICHSNAGSLYVLEGKERLFIRDTEIQVDSEQ